MLSFVQIGNLIIINIILWLIISYFWSNWSFKLFKPYHWLEALKSKSIHHKLRSAERHCKDKNRFYVHWLYLQQIDSRQVNGCVVYAGLEELQYASIASLIDGERSLYLIDTFKTETIDVVKENCQGIVSQQSITIKKPSQQQINTLVSENKQIHLITGAIADNISQIDQPIAFASIDCIRYEDLQPTLRHVYSKLSNGGIILVHDYDHNWDSVRQAVTEFENSIPERFVPLPDMFGSAVLIKNKKM